jgi:hypothetical protein
MEVKLCRFSADILGMNEQRSEPRVSLMARVDAVWKDETGNSRTSRGRLEDSSNNGLCIRVNDPIPVGAKLVVQWREDSISGTVVQCRQIGQNYILGIRRDSAQKPENN